MWTPTLFSYIVSGVCHQDTQFDERLDYLGHQIAEEEAVKAGYSQSDYNVKRFFGEPGDEKK